MSNFGIPVAAVMDTQKDPEMYVSQVIVYLLHVVFFSQHIRVDLRPRKKGQISPANLSTRALPQSSTYKERFRTSQ